MKSSLLTYPQGPQSYVVYLLTLVVIRYIFFLIFKFFLMIRQDGSSWDLVLRGEMLNTDAGTSCQNHAFCSIFTALRGAVLALWYIALKQSFS